MFKKIQNYLLINHPLLWNLKIVPLALILILLNIVFFVIGFINGGLDFTATERNYSSSNDEIIIFFGVLISAITLILWFVYYFKNNAFKSFYPKKNNSLFKEWLLILLASFLLSSQFLSYYVGKDARIKSYFSKEEAIKRCETLSESSIFYGNNEENAVWITKKINDTLKRFTLKYKLFNCKKFELSSLYNKEIESFSFFDTKHDSLTKIKVKNWLFNNKKDSVKTLLNNYLKIVKEHQLDANIDTNRWLSLVYNNPEYNSPYIIAKREKDYYNYAQAVVDSAAVVVDTTAVTVEETEAIAVPVDDYDSNSNYDSVEKYDTLNQYLKTINKEIYVFNKTYVPADALEYNYQKISESWVNPTIQWAQLLVALYFAFGISLILFSFKVTSGKNWLIALVGMGILSIIIGIFSILFRSENTFLIAILLLIVLLFTYFMVVLQKKTSKGISGITLNVLLWFFPTFIPLLYALALEIHKQIYGYYVYNDNFNEKNYPFYTFLKENADSMAWLNLVFIFAMMYFFSVKIKKWRGIAEG